MEHLIVQYYNITILNSVTITNAITTNTTVNSALSKGRTLNYATWHSATSNSAILKWCNIT